MDAALTVAVGLGAALLGVIETINGDVSKAETLRKKIIERMDKADL